VSEARASAVTGLLGAVFVLGLHYFTFIPVCHSHFRVFSFDLSCLGWLGFGSTIIKGNKIIF
jgi:hypothetical protein